MAHKRDDIQGLRAIAVVAVIVFHAGLPLPGGFTGVDVFFVISGFVITSALLREWQNTGSLNLRRFYFRRFKRLAPALSLVVAVTAALSCLLLSPLSAQVEVSAFTGVGALLFCANVVIANMTGDYFQVAASANPLLHTWSLSVEEQFYIAFPAILFLGFLFQTRRSWKWAPHIFVLVVGVVSMAAVAIFSYGLLHSHTIERLLGFYSPFSRAWEFAAGALLVFVPNRINSKLAGPCAYIGIGLLAASFLAVSSFLKFPGYSTLLPVAAGVAMIIAGSKPSPVTAVLSSRPFVVVGDMSYSLYLWHWPIILFGAYHFGQSVTVKVLCALLSVIPAALAFNLVETPLRRYEPRRVASKIPIIIFSFAPTAALCALLVIANQRNYWSPSVQAFRSAVDPQHAGAVRGCGTGYVPTSEWDTKCNFAGGYGVPIYLIGDSNADHFSEPIIAAGLRTRRPVKTFTSGGCNFIGKSWSNVSDAAQRKCTQYVEGALLFLDGARDGSVIIGLSDSVWRGNEAVGDDRASETSDPERKVALLDRELLAAIRRIQGAGHKVTLLQPVAKYIAPETNEVLFDYSSCSTIHVWTGHCPKAVTIPAAKVAMAQHKVRHAIALAASASGADVLDMLRVLCPEGQCANISRSGMILYRDAGHLTVEASKLFTPIFTAWARRDVSSRPARPPALDDPTVLQ